MSASELVLQAAPGASVILRADITLSVGLLVLDGLELRGAAPSRARLLSDSASVPAMVVRGGMLTMRGSTMTAYVLNGALHVLGGEVYIEGSMLADNSAIGLQGGAILVNGGRLSLIRSTMSRNEAEEGGAVAVLAGHFDATQCGFEANRAAKGAAVAVLGSRGIASFDASTISSNAASQKGGALWTAAGGVAVLANGTLIEHNTAPSGPSIWIELGGNVEYRLPAPMGRWVLADNGVSRLMPGGFTDLPYACAPGVFGDSLEFDAQSGPGCSSNCPAGKVCPAACTDPEECPRGSFCSVGSGSPTPCPAGTYGDVAGLASEDGCLPCAAGHWCAQGFANPCGSNTYNPQQRGDSLSYCLPCPDASVSVPGSTGPEDCLCATSYFAANTTPSGEPVCQSCPVGAACDQPGVTMMSLPVLEGYYRASDASSDLRRCPDFGSGSSCIGGVGAAEGPCKPWTQGPYCRLCNVTDTSRYFSVGASACLPCEGSAGTPILLGVGVLVAAIAICLLLVHMKPHRKIPALGKLLRWLTRMHSQLSLRAKVKQLLGLYQIATQISAVYEVSMPEAMARLLSVLELFNFNLPRLGLPLQCLGLRTYQQQLAVTMLMPLITAAVLVLGFLVYTLVGRSANQKLLDLASELKAALPENREVQHAVAAAVVERRRSSASGNAGGILNHDTAVRLQNLAKQLLKPSLHRSVRRLLLAGLLSALPWLLTLMFLVFPMVSSAAFRAFSCEKFDDGRSFLRADYSVECGSDEHYRAKGLAWFGILLYPGGTSVLYAVLLQRVRSAIVHKRPTTLSRALDYMVRDYEPEFFWWELFEMWKKLFLVGFAVLILPGSIEQLFIAFLFSAVSAFFISLARPFQSVMDDYFAKFCAFALTILLFFALLLKVGVLKEEVDSLLSSRLRDRFSFDAAVITAGMISALVVALLLATASAVAQIVAAARLPLLKLKNTKAKPELSRARSHQWHLFLSHIWGTGQDQCAVIKRQLCVLLPGVKIFLDIDDLGDIGLLEEYIDMTAVITIFASKGYFKSISANTRYIYAHLAPPSHTSHAMRPLPHPLASDCLREVNCTVAKAKPIVLVHDNVRGGATLDFIRNEECPEELRDPIFRNRRIIGWHRARDFQLVSLKLLAEQLLLGCPVYRDEPSLSLYVPGEIAAQRLAFHKPVVLYASPNNPGAGMIALRLAGAMKRLTIVSQPAPADGDGKPAEATHFMLYLTSQTFVGPKGEALAEEVRRARRLGGAKIVMLHENDFTNEGCEFGRCVKCSGHDPSTSVPTDRTMCLLCAGSLKPLHKTSSPTGCTRRWRLPPSLAPFGL